jgi:ribose-phosphate pyrophosphokinase
MKRIVLVSGTSNLVLAEKISEFLDVALIDPHIYRFSNSEIFCKIDRNVRGADVFVIQTMGNPVNDNLMELLIMLDALKRASAHSITAVIPHYGYARQDRKTVPRTPISAKLVADLLTVSGALRVITLDVHAGQIQGFFNIPFDNIYASPILLRYIKEHLFTDNTIFVSPDAGGMERVRHYAKKLKCDIAMVDKRRIGKNIAKAMNIVGDVEGKECVIIDDMIDTAGTLVESAVALKKSGALKVYACATHAVFSDPALDRIENSEELDRVIVTDTLRLSERGTKIEKIEVLSTAELLSKAIHRTFNNDSVSSLFI